MKYVFEELSTRDILVGAAILIGAYLHFVEGVI